MAFRRLGLVLILALTFGCGGNDNTTTTPPIEEILPTVTVTEPSTNSEFTHSSVSLILKGEKSAGLGVWLKHSAGEQIFSDSMAVAADDETTWTISLILRGIEEDDANINTLELFAAKDSETRSAPLVVEVSLQLLNPCDIDNGNCGDPQFVTCTPEPNGGLNCDDINECETNNGDCGDPQFYECTNNDAAAHTCGDINECATDNGGCGNPQFVNCANNIGAAPTCTDINECEFNNGGCDTNASCTDNQGAAPTCTCNNFYEGNGTSCTDIDECTTNNGECGEAQYYSCTNNTGAAPTCADIDECATNNGECGEAQYFSCTNNTGAAPTCVALDVCTTNNGGCGASTHYSCRSNGAAPPTCDPLFGTNRVLFIGLDGTRASVMDLPSVSTPNIDALKAKGIYSNQGQTGDVSYSGPGWSNSLTGVWRDKHNVANNTVSTHHYGNAAPFTNGTDYPDFIGRLESINSNYITGWVNSWDQLEYLPGSTAADHRFYQSYSVNDDFDSVIQAKTMLANQDIHAMFVYFAMIDVAGHGDGFHSTVPEYKTAIELADSQIGELLGAIESRAQYANENWLIVVAPDHGGSSGNVTSHGANAPYDRTVFLLLSGEKAVTRTSSGGKIYPHPHQVDIAPSIFAHLGVNADPNWGLDGNSILSEGSKPAAQFGSNIVENPGAEVERGFSSMSLDAPITGWEENYGGIPIAYDSTDYPTSAGHPNGGANFFSGGTTKQSTMLQTIDVSHLALDVDSQYAISVDLGGYITQEDDATLNIRFLNNDQSSAVKWNATTAYFFRGDQYWIYDISNDAVDGAARDIATDWPGLASFDGGATNIDAILNYGNGKAYFFKGTQYSRFDIATRTVDAGYPLTIEGNWSGLSLFEGGAKDIDAAYSNGTTAYFFKGKEYVRYDVASDSVSARYPRDISQETWDGLHVWCGKIDAALYWSSDVAYFFKEGAYIRFNLDDDKADSDYPRHVDGAMWPGLTEWNATHRLVQLGPVTPAERNNENKLVTKSANGTIPAGTQSIEVELLFSVDSGSSDGYADNISVILTQ